MIRRLYLSVVLSLICGIFPLAAQEMPVGPATPGGVFDTLCDLYGKKYNIRQLSFNSSDMTNLLQQSVATTSCSAGYFNVYFELGSGMDGNTTAEIDRRNVICQLFSDVSAFINSPLTNVGNTTKVNIWVRNIVNMGVPTPSTSGVLGLASSFYAMPGSPTASGIHDNLIWQTIVSGTDAYTNVVSPLSPNAPGGSMFHGQMAFNFVTPTINWHTNLSQQTGTGLYDLYSVALHELTHALGFASLIDQYGASKFGSNFNYYNRYDQHMKTQSGQALITNTGSCSLYAYGWNASLNTGILQPAFTGTNNCIVDQTICNTAINYVFNSSATQMVYTPNCFASASTLSHFEDQCQVPSTFTVVPSNNMYFVMSNANGFGPTYMKRYLKPEERSVLCDIGYNVNTTYGSSTYYSYYNYGGSACPGLQVAGINDGITSGGAYAYIGNVNTPIAINGVLSNDYNAVSFECMEVVVGTGTLSNTSGTSFSFTPTNVGVSLLRYIPVASNGNRGNITYVYVFGKPGSCTPSACNMMNNGSFESMASNAIYQCGDGYPTYDIYLNCWYYYINSPDLYTRGCVNSGDANSNTYNLGTVTWLTNPVFDSHNPSSGNNRVLGMAEGYLNSGVPKYSEASQNFLSSPLQTGQAYQLSFWAYNYKGQLTYPNIPPQGGTLYNVNPSATPQVITFAATPSVIAQGALNTANYPTAAMDVVLNYTLSPVNTWTYVTTTFTYSGAANDNVFFVGTDNAKNIAAGWSATVAPGTSPNNKMHYVLLDDISLIPVGAAASFSLPVSVFTCTNNTQVTNLSQYASPPGGSFSGPGVSYTGGQYNFDPNTAGNGLQQIVYTYTNNVGCVQQVTQQVTVNMVTPTLSATSYSLCSGQTTTITASGANTYTWMPGGANTASIAVTPTVSTTYTVKTGNLTGCVGTTTVLISVGTTPTVNATASSTIICAPQTVTLTASGATSYTWTPIVPAYVNPAVTSPTANTVYTVTGSNPGCSLTSSQTVTVMASNSLTVTVVSTASTLCSGQSATLTASGASSFTWQPGGTVSNSISVTPSSTTVYTVTAPGGCTWTKTINVLQSPSVSINTPTLPSLCAAVGASSLISITATPTPTNASLTWVATAGTLTIPATQYTITGNSITYNLTAYTSGTVPVIVNCSATSNSCVATTSLGIYPCCGTGTNVAKYTNTTFTANPTFTGNVAFSGTITVNSGVTLALSGQKVFMDPNTRIVLNGNALFDVRNINMFGCYAMWDGIYANNTSGVRVNQSVISDALSAINDPAGAASFTLTSNYFNKNMQSVSFGAIKTSTSTVVMTNNLFTTSTFTLQSSSPWFTTIPSLATAATFSAYPAATLLPPYSGKNAAFGVYGLTAGKTGATNGALVIGGASNGSENVFDKLHYGACGINSSFAYQNNVFQNMKLAINNAQTDQCVGIKCTNLSGATTLTNTVGGSSTSLKNTFTNCDYGLSVSGKTTLLCNYNRFEQQNMGVFVTTNSNNTLSDVSSNKFVGCGLGIDFYNNANINASIKENVMTYTASTGSNYGIVVAEIGSPANAKYNIYNNRMDGYYIGMYVSGTYSATIADNEVHMAQSGGAFEFGLQNVGGTSNSITNNLVDMPSLNTGAWYQAGIFTDQSTTPLIRCNTVNYLYNGIAANGKCLTSPGGGIQGNTMNTCVHGFNLDGQGEIGSQYIGTNSSADNIWTNCTNETMSGTGCNTLTAVFYTRSSTPYSITNPTVAPAGNYLYGTNNSAASSITCTSVATPTLNLKMSGAATLNKLMQNPDNVANGNYNFGNNDANAKHILRKQLYYQVMLQNVDPTITPGINGLMNSFKNKSIGKFWVIDSLLNMGDSTKWNFAFNLNNSINPQNDADATQQAFNSAFITYLKNNRNFSPTELAGMESIAALCPYIYGDGVHQARAILLHVTQKQYINSCEFPANKGSVNAKLSNHVDGGGISLYPNPNDGAFVFESGDDQTYELQVYSILGEKLWQQTVNSKNVVNLQYLPSATYIVRVTKGAELVKTTRICIIK